MSDPNSTREDEPESRGFPPPSLMGYISRGGGTIYAPTNLISNPATDEPFHTIYAPPAIHDIDALTTRGSRIPSTLTGMPPIAAYNLGWQEGRDSMPVEEPMSVLVTPDGEQIPIPRRILEQIRTIEWGPVPTFPSNQTDDVINVEDVLNSMGDDEPSIYAAAFREPRIGVAAFREDAPTQAEEPIEDRLRRAYRNGLEQGLELAHRAHGRWDHS